LGCKTVVTMHDAIFLRYPELYSRTYVNLFTRKNREACEQADLIIAISEQTKQDYMSFFHVNEDRIRVVYQGCYEGFWSPVSITQLTAVQQRWRLPSQYVLSVGALEARKNALTLIDALQAAHIDLPLVLVGRGKEEYKAQLFERAKQANVQLMLIEDATMQDLPAIYHLASVFVYPSLFEGFGIPVLEAARSGIPVVASTGTCFEEIAGEGALYADPHNAEAIGDHILHLLDNPALAQQQVQIALQNTEHFRDECIANNMWNVYQEVL